ncbi:meiotic nuclear division protein 1 [Phyllosticta citriasiana]|uniref:Meiotic nuclear division protein 1 n=1 Tax=Phyllosticta citriasiana TaxID=595635 RepID=A0ABR1KUS4_9PEZI
MTLLKILVATIAPKSLPPAAKQALILDWFHESGVAHSIKDLEKALPAVASINAMQVKDYLQALSDDNKIRVEKIGSGNWYWSFPSEVKRDKEAELARAQSEWDKAARTLEELGAKVDQMRAAREDEEELEAADSRQELTQKMETLKTMLAGLRKELASYSDSDPVEMELKRGALQRTQLEAEKWTDQIQSMEMWFKEQMGGDREALLNMKRIYYGDEFDDEDEGLREL